VHLFGRNRPGAAKSRRQPHIDWLRLIDVNGPFLSVPVLADEWPDLEPLDAPKRDRLGRVHREWLTDQAVRRGNWITYVLRDLLSWSDAAALAEDLSSLALEVPEHEVVITPTFTLRDPATGDIRLLGLVSDGSPVARIKGSDWPATPADRLAQLCRARKIELGLATNGRWWTLVWSSPEGTTSMGTWDAISWPEASERTVLRAFVSLLQRRRFLAIPADRQLPALFRRSLDNQEELTDRLGVQIRMAVELLVAAFGRAGVPAEVTAQNVYGGAVLVMMRIVFLLYAEAIGLLPADNALYASSYSVGGLHELLEQRVIEARGNEAELDHTYLAWHRLLALFTGIDRGIKHPDLDLQAYDGTLFDPDRHPWFPLAVDDRTVLHMLRSVQTVTLAGERRTVSFATLQVEQIGFVYEGLLSFGGLRAAEVVVGLIGKEGREAEVSLAALEELAVAPDPAAQIADAFKDSGIGSTRAIAARLASLVGDERAHAETKLYAVTRDHRLVNRLLPFYRLIRQDLRGDPVVILLGQLYVTESVLRAATGTHYTPAHLARQVAEGALEPLVYYPGPLQTADTSRWKLRRPEEILSLRIADIAVGSGAFLVAACRYLADKLVEAWSIEGDADIDRAVTEPDSQSRGTSDATADPVVIDARRRVIEHCLYGVDVNEMAVEMAKMSLWIISMDRDRPFTFLDDKLAVGDSLLGITSIEQLEWMHLDVEAGRALHEDALLDYSAGMRDLLIHAAEQRRLLADLPDDIDGVHKKRASLIEVVDKTRHLRRYSDLLAGAALAGTGRRGLWLAAAKQADDAFARGREAGAAATARTWLATGQTVGTFDREPLHWPLVFPEVLGPDAGPDPGFDAIIGNPPYLGGQKLTGLHGTAYREYLVEWIGGGVRGSSDLVAYFLLRAHHLLNKRRGQTGLIATNTVAQGDTREVGLDQIVAGGTEIRQAVKSKRWPAKSAALEYSAVWTSVCRVDHAGKRFVDDVAGARATSSLDTASRIVGNPKRLAANVGLSFQGSIVLGLGFTLESARASELIARDPRNKDVLFPYVNGQDLNSRPDCSGSRWVVNFHDWPLEKAQTYTDPYAQVLREVKPERDANNRKVYRDYWWQYAEKRPAMVRATIGLDRVIVIARVSKVVIPVMVATGHVMSDQTVVFAIDDTGILAVLSSAPHYWWAIERASTLETRIRYTPSDVFETLPLPSVTTEMRGGGDRLDTFRRNLMLARQAGLTATYNLVHDPRCADADITELRGIHRRIDEAVVGAYRWTDLLASGLDHGFHDTRQGTRYTIGPAVRQEILDRLLELNHARHAAEQAAGHHRTNTRKHIADDHPDDNALF
jgi:Eco57I restriction-modification methylase/restriction-modification enzyme MmeI-like protein